MITELILLITIIILFLDVCRSKYIILEKTELLNKYSDSLRMVTKRLKATTEAYIILVDKILPDDKKVKKAFNEYKEALNDYDKETEEYNKDIRLHHFKIAEEKFQMVCEEYDKKTPKT